MKPEQILEIADKNGFDNFGLSMKIYQFVGLDNTGKTLMYPMRNLCSSRSFSLADLATNKSFLEALAKVKNRHYHLRHKERLINDDATGLMYHLCDFIMENKSKDFWSIISEFIGENKWIKRT